MTYSKILAAVCCKIKMAHRSLGLGVGVEGGEFVIELFPFTLRWDHNFFID